MKIAMIFYLLLCTALLGAEDAQPPALTPSERAIVEAHMREARANFATACINLNRDIQEKKITVYSVESSVKSSITNIADFRVQTLYHPELSVNYDQVSGSYMSHYNSCLLDFALT